MKTTHDPLREIDYLQQCLSQNKKPLGLFLGAGCPFSIKEAGSGSPLIPDIDGITVAVREELTASGPHAPAFHELESHFATDGHPAPNIERILSHIRALRAIAGKGKARGLTAAELDTLDAEICRIIHRLADKALPPGVSPYHQVAEWVDATTRTTPIELFTTNYDLLMEQAFEERKVPYFDGFPGGCRPPFNLRAMEEDQLSARWARLWKLHGSINWYKDAGRSVFRGGRNEAGLKRVIHPSHLKYDESRRMPYLAMMDRLRAFLKQPGAALILCGYSFRDDHINEVIVQGLEGNQRAVAFALLFSDIDHYSMGISLSLARPNLSVLAEDEGILGGCRAKWEDRDSGNVPVHGHEWLTWAPIDAGDPDGRKTPHVCLGDFVMFGAFLHELIGDTRERGEATSGK